MEYVRVGQVLRPFGIKGAVRCYSLTDFPQERFLVGRKLSLLMEKTGLRQELTIAAFRPSGPYFFLSFKEIATPEEAKAIAGGFLEMDKSEAPLPEGYYRLEDLKGCAVIDDVTGESLGVVIDVLAAAPVKNLVVVRPSGKRFYVPFLQGPFLTRIDLAHKELEIRNLPGLL